MSSWHENVTPASVSLKEKLALVAVVGLAGCAVIDGTGGGVRSIVQVNAVAELTLPAASFASTENVCDPAARLLYAFGLEQAANAPASSLHKNDAPASLSLNENDADVWFEGLAGCEVIDGAGGGVRSIVKLALACEAGVVVLPALSVALACTVYEPSGGAASG
jgi:hypothetical protein